LKQTAGNGVQMAIEAFGSSRPIHLSGVGQRCPHVVITSFLGADFVEQLLLHVEERRDAFKPATVYNRESREDRLNRESRNCLRLDDIGPFKTTLKQAIEEILPTATRMLGILRQQAKAREFEFCAYGDGAFFAPHIDTAPSTSRRVVSCVYYFFRQPPCFSGGALRLFGWPNVSVPASDAVATIDVIPQRDSLTIFPSSLRHEVRPIVCPSDEWRDYRFSINCWARQP
jgi:Rps23 Pro-64 3,4-dihydroxylase Tpa1-like proline 4-hydroxylase